MALGIAAIEKEKNFTGKGTFLHAKGWQKEVSPSLQSSVYV